MRRNGLRVRRKTPTFFFLTGPAVSLVSPSPLPLLPAEPLSSVASTFRRLRALPPPPPPAAAPAAESDVSLDSLALLLVSAVFFARDRGSVMIALRLRSVCANRAFLSSFGFFALLLVLPAAVDFDAEVAAAAVGVETASDLVDCFLGVLVDADGVDGAGAVDATGAGEAGGATGVDAAATGVGVAGASDSPVAAAAADFFFPRFPLPFDAVDFGSGSLESDRSIIEA